MGPCNQMTAEGLTVRALWKSFGQCQKRALMGHKGVYSPSLSRGSRQNQYGMNVMYAGANKKQSGSRQKKTTKENENSAAAARACWFGMASCCYQDQSPLSMNSTIMNANFKGKVTWLH